MVIIHALALSDSPGLHLPPALRQPWLVLATRAPDISREISGAGGTEASVECAHILMKRI
jgi:hypothetical protein